MMRQGPRFTEAARAAAAQKRRERAALKAETKGDLEVFVLRSELAPGQYGWEIRQFGGVVVDRSGRSFPSSMQARADGLEMLDRLPEPESRPIQMKRVPVSPMSPERA